MPRPYLDDMHWSVSPESRTGTARPATVLALLGGVVDYAGLFPPAGLPMAAAVAEYLAARSGPDAWMLGRFVLPASRLGEFAAVAAARAEIVTLSAIVRDAADEDRAAVLLFNHDSARHRAIVDTIESKPQTLDGIDRLAESFGPDYDVYVEVAAGDDAGRWLERVRDRGLKAKVRTGGLTADAFPGPSSLMIFIDDALRLQIPFKATAGLHHAVRGTYRLTYQTGSAVAPMYGYLNLLLATAGRRAGLPRSDCERLLQLTDAAALDFGERFIRWGSVELPLDVLRAVRDHTLVSFGSCSFTEPVGDLHALMGS